VKSKNPDVKECKLSVRQEVMFRKLKELYKTYKPYVRVDLIMYGVLILLIIVYFIISVIWL
jgi:hypothetical protein